MCESSTTQTTTPNIPEMSEIEKESLDLINKGILPMYLSEAGYELEDVTVESDFDYTTTAEWNEREKKISEVKRLENELQRKIDSPYTQPVEVQNLQSRLDFLPLLSMKFLRTDEQAKEDYTSAASAFILKYVPLPQQQEALKELSELTRLHELAVSPLFRSIQ